IKLKRSKRNCFVSIVLVFLLSSVIGCSNTKSISANFQKNDPWAGTVKLQWNRTHIILTGTLNYNGSESLKEVEVKAHYKETALGLPEGYTLPYKNAEQKFTSSQPEKSFDIYDEARIYKTVNHELGFQDAQRILDNIVFEVEYVDRFGNRNNTEMVINNNGMAADRVQQPYRFF
ncbi:MAG: hypothetical protein ACYC21_16035, partial [Eubacteriales bacterium]